MDLVQAKDTFAYGNNYWLHKGDLYPADDPLVVAHPDWFGEPEVIRTGPPAVKKQRNVATRTLEDVRDE